MSNSSNDDYQQFFGYCLIAVKLDAEVSQGVAHWWAKASPRARLMARPGIHAYCSHTLNGPIGWPDSSTSLEEHFGAKLLLGFRA